MNLNELMSTVPVLENKSQNYSVKKSKKYEKYITTAKKSLKI